MDRYRKTQHELKKIFKEVTIRETKVGTYFKAKCHNLCYTDQMKLRDLGLTLLNVFAEDIGKLSISLDFKEEEK